MSRPTPTARVRSRVAAHATPLVVQPDPSPDPDNPSINLLGNGPGGVWALRVPLAAFPMADTEPGHMMTVVLGIQQTHMEPEDKPSIILPTAENMRDLDG